MPLLALVSGNPPSTHRFDPATCPPLSHCLDGTRNPLALGLSGPTLTIAPFSPVSKFSLDLLGLGFRGNTGKRKNPPASSVVFNVFTEEARRYPNPPHEAVELAWASDHSREGLPHGRLPVQTGAGFARSGPWLARLPQANPRPPRGRIPARVAFNFEHQGLTKGNAWAHMTLEIMFQVRQTDSLGYDEQPRHLERPAVFVSAPVFLEVYGKIAKASSEIPPSRDTALRAYERWKSTTRAAALERPDALAALPAGALPIEWFAFDAFGAFDLAWAILGTPHPRDMLVGLEYGVYATGQEREDELLAGAAARIPPYRPLPGEPTVLSETEAADQLMRQEINRERARIERARSKGDFESYEGFRGKSARRFAVRPGFEARVAALTAPPPPPFVEPPPGPETAWESFRREKAAWQIARESAIRERLPIPSPPVPPGFVTRPSVPRPPVPPLVEPPFGGFGRPVRPRPSRAGRPIAGLAIPLATTSQVLDAISWLWSGSDEDLERAAGLARGWLARARAGGSQYGRAREPWRRLKAFLERRAAGMGSSLALPEVNPRDAELARLTNPDRPRRRNRDSKWKSPPETVEVSLAEARKLPGFEAAIQKYKRFHGTEPKKAVVYRIPDGKKSVTRDPDVLVALHETLEVPYQVPWASTKHGDDKEPITWFHEFPEGTRPMKVLNPRTGITSDVGGSYLVDDYWYS